MGWEHHKIYQKNNTTRLQQKFVERVVDKNLGEGCILAAFWYSFQKHQANEPSYHRFPIFVYKEKRVTLPKFNSSPQKSDLPNRKLVFQPPFFRGYVKLQGCSLITSIVSKHVSCLVFFLTRLENCFVCNPLLPCKESPMGLLQKNLSFPKY